MIGDLRVLFAFFLIGGLLMLAMGNLVAFVWSLSSLVCLIALYNEKRLRERDLANYKAVENLDK